MAKKRKSAEQKQAHLALCAKFAAYMNQLSILQHRDAVALIKDKCLVSSQQISAWKSGAIAIRPLYQKTIEEALGVKIFD